MQTITKDIAKDLILNSKGKIFNVNFMKQDNTARSLTGRLNVRKGITGKGLAFSPKDYALISVYDINKNAFRFISIEKVYGLAINGNEYKVE